MENSTTKRGRKPGTDMGGTVKVKCAHCKKPVSLHKSDLPHGKHHFCSREHSAAYYHAQAGHGPRASYKCAWCGTAVERYPSQVKSPDRVFCTGRTADSCYYQCRRNDWQTAKQVSRKTGRVSR